MALAVADGLDRRVEQEDGGLLVLEQAEVHQQRVAGPTAARCAACRSPSPRVAAAEADLERVLRVGLRLRLGRRLVGAGGARRRARARRRLRRSRRAARARGSRLAVVALVAGRGLLRVLVVLLLRLRLLRVDLKMSRCLPSTSRPFARTETASRSRSARRRGRRPPARPWPRAARRRPRPARGPWPAQRHGHERRRPAGRATGHSRRSHHLTPDVGQKAHSIAPVTAAGGRGGSGRGRPGGRPPARRRPLRRAGRGTCWR